MIDLEPLGHVAPGDHAVCVAVLERAADMGRYGPSEMADSVDVYPVGDDTLRMAFAQFVDGSGQRDGPDAGDLAGLAFVRLPRRSAARSTRRCIRVGGRRPSPRVHRPPVVAPLAAPVVASDSVHAALGGRAPLESGPVDLVHVPVTRATRASAS